MTPQEPERAIDEADVQPDGGRAAAIAGIYQLREAPFTDTRDPKFLYMAQSHQEALASLYYGVESGAGFQTLIAAPGMGKTMLLFRVLERWRGTPRTVFLIQHGCNTRQLLQYLLGDIGGDASALAALTMRKRVRDAFASEPQAGRRLVMVIDEAESLEEGTLEMIDVLAGLEPPDPEFLQLVFAARPAFEKRLARPHLEALRARIAFTNRLRPLSPEDTRVCIEHRLKAAGHPTGEIFTPEAIVAIARASGGVLREICAIAGEALSAGEVLGQPIIDVDVIRDVVSTRVPPEPEAVAEAERITPPEIQRAAPDAKWWVEVSNARRALQRELEEDDIPRLVVETPLEPEDASELTPSLEATPALEAEAAQPGEAQETQSSDVQEAPASELPEVQASETQEAPASDRQEEAPSPGTVVAPGPSRGAARKAARARQRAEGTAASRGATKKDRRPRKPSKTPKALRRQADGPTPPEAPPLLETDALAASRAGGRPAETPGATEGSTPRPAEGETPRAIEGETPPAAEAEASGAAEVETPRATGVGAPRTGEAATPHATDAQIPGVAAETTRVVAAEPRRATGQVDGTAVLQSARQPQPAAADEVAARFAAALLAWDAFTSRAIAAAADAPVAARPPSPAPVQPAPPGGTKTPRLNAIEVLSAIGYHPAVTPRARRRRNVIVGGVLLLLLAILLMVLLRTGR